MPVDDGLILGSIRSPQLKCEVCGIRTKVILINEIVLPKGLVPGNTMIAYTNEGSTLRPIGEIGIGCGCYARFHRQMGHITTLRKVGGKK